VAVPTHFFKVIVGETETHDLEMEAFVLPNEAIPDSTPLASFQVTRHHCLCYYSYQQ
jgi:endonuclease G